MAFIMYPSQSSHLSTSTATLGSVLLSFDFGISNLLIGLPLAFSFFIQRERLMCLSSVGFHFRNTICGNLNMLDLRSGIIISFVLVGVGVAALLVKVCHYGCGV